jgi:HK97 family phage portal protein
VTVFGRVLSARNASIESPTVPISAPTVLEYIGGGATGHAGVSVTETGALGLSAVYRAVGLNAGVAASLPLHVYRPGDEGRVKVTSGRAAELLDNPHPDLTPLELWEIVYAHLQLWGNAYLRVLRDELYRDRELWPVHPARVRAGRTSETGTKVYSIDGGKEVHTDETLLHIPGFGYDGITGVSPIRVAREGFGLAMAAEQFGARFFGSGSLATGVLQVEQRLKQEQADRLHREWKARHSGMQSAHDIVVLDSGATFNQLTIPPGDAQFIESRRFQTAEVCRMFGVPPFLMFETEKSTSWGTGLEQQALGWVVYDLRRWLMRIEARVTKRIRPQAVYARYAVEGLLRGDSAARSAFYTAMIQNGVLSINEVRELEERGPIEGGDIHYRPLNLGAIGEEDETAEQEPAPAPAEPEPTRVPSRS